MKRYKVIQRHSKVFKGIQRCTTQFELCSEGLYKFVKAQGCVGEMSKGVPKLRVRSGPIILPLTEILTVPVSRGMINKSRACHEVRLKFL